jgi:hypothetical protein
LLVVVAISAGLVAVAAAPANALSFWYFTENFENNPAATWWFENGPGDFTNTNGIAHSGTQYADITRWDEGWISVDRSLVLPAGFFRNCTASAWFSGYGDSLLVRIEIINPVSWTYVALTGVYVWQQNSISWSGGANSVVFRATIINTGGGPVRAKVDDVGLACTVY